MIREVTEEEMKNIRMNVTLNNGTEYLGADITDEPISEKENFVRFWHENKLLAFPTTQVFKVEFIFE